MVANLCLLTCVLATAQPAGGPGWAVAPRLGRGEELLYSGTFSEEAADRGVRLTRAYGLQTRLFVLDTPPGQTDLAVLTTLRIRSNRPGAEAREPCSVRLEVVHLDAQGRLLLDNRVPVALPLDGPATLECGTFVEVPRGVVRLGQTWEVAEPGRPAWKWQAAGTELIMGMNCVKLVGVQQSDDWDRPRGDRSAWRRRDVVWVAPNVGIAYRVERAIERREPLRTAPTERSVTTYSLDSRVAYRAQLFEDRRREVLLARELARASEPCLRSPEKNGVRPLEAVVAKIDYHTENHPGTPFRQALQHLRRRAEAVRRGDWAPVGGGEEAEEAPTRVALDHPAPDFAATDLQKRQAVQLRRVLGKPVLLVFYDPTARSAAEVLQYAQKTADDGGTQQVVLALAVAGETEQILKQRADLRVTVPVLAGHSVRVTYDVQATPKLVVLDAAGVVRGAYVGWGPETRSQVAGELASCRRQAGR